MLLYLHNTNLGRPTRTKQGLNKMKTNFKELISGTLLTLGVIISIILTLVSFILVTGAIAQLVEFDFFFLSTLSSWALISSIVYSKLEIDL